MLGRVTWNRDVMLLALALAVLGAAGLDALVRNEMPARFAALGPRCARGGGAGRGARVRWRWRSGAQHTTGGGTRSRLAWAAAEVVVGVALVLAVGLGHVAGPDTPGPRRDGRRGVAVGLLVAQSAFLVVAGVSFWSLSSSVLLPHPRRRRAPARRGIVGRGHGAVPSQALYLPLRHRVRHPAQCQHRLPGPRVRGVRAGAPHRVLRVVGGGQRPAVAAQPASGGPVLPPDHHGHRGTRVRRQLRARPRHQPRARGHDRVGDGRGRGAVPRSRGRPRRRCRALPARGGTRPHRRPGHGPWP